MRETPRNVQRRFKKMDRCLRLETRFVELSRRKPEIFGHRRSGIAVSSLRPGACTHGDRVKVFRSGRSRFVSVKGDRGDRLDRFADLHGVLKLTDPSWFHPRMCYISSQPPKASAFSDSDREHLGIESKNWSLDVLWRDKNTGPRGAEHRFPGKLLSGSRF